MIHWLKRANASENTSRWEDVRNGVGDPSSKIADSGDLRSEVQVRDQQSSNPKSQIVSGPSVGFSAIDSAAAGIDVWLDTMRGLGGYGGPVVHWWQQSMVYTGAGRDWRYEGIIDGYLRLWNRTRDENWLEKARRAGDDLVAGQLQNGHYLASAFEINPASAGTPHEAACDAGLLLLAHSLKSAGRADWEHYVACAEKNLSRFYVGQLWDAEVLAFRDSPSTPSFVPNKAATACEALFLLAEITQTERWIETYALPTLNRIISHQVSEEGSLDGAIAQNSFGSRRVEKYFPIYIARCVAALLHGYRWTGDAKYADCALRAMRFVARWSDEDGALPTVIYPHHRVNRYPSWIAPLGDILRAVDEVRPLGFDADFGATLSRLLNGQDASGGIQTAFGFQAQSGGQLGVLRDVRDVLHVAGWCDKAFRYLATHVGPQLPAMESKSFETRCTFRGQTMQVLETPSLLEVSQSRRVCYRWRKGDDWAEVASPEFWLR